MKSDTQSNKNKNIIYGIDFGTSNSSIVAWNPVTRSIVETTSLVETEPTLLYFPYPRSFYDRLDQRYFADEAMRRYLGDNMDGRLLQSIKTVLSDRTFKETMINGSVYEIEDLIALYLGYLKGKMDRLLGINCQSVVLGRPAVFNEDPDMDLLAQNRLREAAIRAGFKAIHFQLEPIAAALRFESTLTREITVLVGDFGGGTSDFTIMRLDPARLGKADREQDILASGGVAVAGNKLDAAIMWYKLTPLFGRGANYREFRGGRELRAPTWVHRQICQWDRLPFLAEDIKLMELLKKMALRSDNREGFSRLIEFIKSNLGYALFRQIEKAKIGLTETDGEDIIFQEGSINIEEHLAFKAFKFYTKKEIRMIADCLDGVVGQAGLSIEEIDVVFLTGGSSLVRPIRQLFVDRFGADKIHGGETFTSVARGLAMSSSLFEF